MNNSHGDRDSTAWWQGLEQRKLQVQRCECGELRWAPRAMCNACGSFDWEWFTTDGRGTVVTWTATHRAFSPRSDVPFVVVLVRLDAGENLLVPGGWGGDRHGSDLTVGQQVVAEFTTSTPGDGDPAALIRWTRSNQAN
ncbi:MAG: OB-fold domain-containing protein [Rhodococcus sp. (in: high G+C Gram-positive bacteria)]